MDHSIYLISFIAVCALATYLTRLLPFVLFSRNAEHPLLLHLGRYLPAAVMMLLVIYCYKEISPHIAPYGLPELLAGAVVIIIHLWRANALLSIACGTALYMYLVQNTVFA